jgi:hypothetical protein
MIPVIKNETKTSKVMASKTPLSKQHDLNYVFLDQEPPIPSERMPTKKQSFGHEYISMVQLCNIAEQYGLTRSKVCNAFGGDKGKYNVKPTRMARAAWIGNQLRKYVLTSAVEEYFLEMGIDW